MAQKTHILSLLLLSPFLLVLLVVVKVGQLIRRVPHLFLTSYFLIAKPTTRGQSYRRLQKLHQKKRRVFDPSGIFLKVARALNLKKHPGRPRQQGLIRFYIHRFLKKLRQVIPHSLRIKIALGCFLVILIIYSLLLSQILAELPSPKQLVTTERPLTTQIFDRNGELLYQFYEGRNRKLVTLPEIPPQLVQATIAMEDQHFFTHPGIDLLGILRAARANIAQGPQRSLEGGSTITQQLIKNTLLSPDQTFGRKLKEAILAFWAERIYSKQDILQMYFNEVPYGGPAWGVEAAAEMYFGKKVSDLDLAESAYLAGLPAAPTLYSPYGIYPQLGKTRQADVLQRMVEEGYITSSQKEEALAKNLQFQPPTTDIKAPHFVMYVRQVLAEKYGQRTVAQGGLKVITTLDLGIQQMTESVVAKQIASLTNLGVGNGAAMVTDPQTGQILAMAGSKNYFDPQGGNYNATLALRQPGSSIKPVTYAAAFEQGYSPGTVLLDTPTSFPNAWGQSYAPVNYDGTFHGPVSIRRALGSSYNIPAVKMLAIVGVPKMAAVAREMGITTFTDPDSYGLSLTLGGAAVRLIDMMGVYGTLAAGGIKHNPNPILTVVDPKDDVIEDHRQPGGQRVLTEEITYMLSSILSDDNARSPAFGKNSLLAIPNRTVAVKTGTSDEKKDNWTFGYTPQFVVGVWVGNNDNTPMNPALTSGITGATPIWHEIMANLLAGQPDTAFKRPAGVTVGTVDGNRDLVIRDQVPKTVIGYRTVKQPGEKDVTTYSDPFSIFTPGTAKATQ